MGTWGTIRRPNGRLQVTYNRLPLYAYAHEPPRVVRCNNVNGWFVVAGLKETLDPADGLWVAWPKRSSGIESDLDFATVQAVGLGHGLVDNKSCSIDDAWQALRFVYRVKDRPAARARQP